MTKMSAGSNAFAASVSIRSTPGSFRPITHTHTQSQDTRIIAVIRSDHHRHHRRRRRRTSPSGPAGQRERRLLEHARAARACASELRTVRRHGTAQAHPAVPGVPGVRVRTLGVHKAACGQSSETKTQRDKERALFSSRIVIIITIAIAIASSRPVLAPVCHRPPPRLVSPLASSPTPRPSGGRTDQNRRRCEGGLPGGMLDRPRPLRRRPLPHRPVCRDLRATKT